MSDAPQKQSAPEEQEGQEPAREPMTARDLAQMAQDYHVPMTTQTIDAIVGDGKEISPERATAFEDYIRRQAAGLYPTMAPQLATGLKTSDLLEPYRQIGKQVLGQQYEPDFQTNSHDRAALEGGADPSTGRPIPMTLSQWQAHLKSDPFYGYQSSPRGQQEQAAVKQRILQGLGASNG